MRNLLWPGLMIFSAAAAAGQPPPTIGMLRTEQFEVGLRYERELDPGDGFRAYLVSYRSAGFKVYAYVAVPASAKPAAGYPVLIANHGTHLDPPRYGFTAAGVDSRPGDYYRAVPGLYAAHGFMVIMPDYRGHNASEGGEYAHGFLASNYYAEDVLALLSSVATLPDADPDNVFMWGHSLGGEVTLKALLATGRVRAASLWSTVGGTIWEQAWHYSTRSNEGQPFDSSDRVKEAVVGLRAELAAIGPGYDWQDSDPSRFLEGLGTPLILHHSVGDASVPFEWSRHLAGELYLMGRRYEFYSYAGTDHFFEGEDRQQAVARDVAFFHGMTKPPG